ncbi:MtrB/PioB family decaheme-associated outer membrane protein [Herbaspirillum sp. HC18]|nr:MtrB/PioB family decaheme-associated outer membrane protein [Herbaspirillum sp. HC18]
MKTSKQHFGFSQKVMVLAIFAAFGPAHAQEDIAEFIKPDTTEVRAGLGAVSGDSKDRAIWGQYNGMRKNDFYGLFDFDYIKRDDEAGLWTNFQGRNLGLETREVRFGQQKQGDWKYSFEYSELLRNALNTINTGMVNAGTATPTVRSLAVRGTGQDIDLETKRKAVTLGLEKWLMPNLQFEATFKNEDKDGARLFGRGLNCATTGTIVCPGAASGAILVLPEPIDSTIRQIDAKLNFSGEKFLVSAAYYGSFYDNANGSLRPTIGSNLFNPNGTVINTAANPGLALAGFMQQPLALQPDNQAHQLSLFGNYMFTPTTRANFKYAYTHATQNEDFASMGLTGGPAGITNLGGRLDTTVAQAGITSQPMPKLSLLANVRYEDRDNKTPVGFYSPTAGQTNVQNSLTKTAGKAEASYSLPENYRATLGLDYETVDFGIPVNTYVPGGLNLLREKTHETSYRAELRRSMSETLTGAISYVYSNRDGSDWLRAAAGTPALSDIVAAAEANGRPVTPVMFMDRTRNKVKLMADWTPVERLSLQFIVEDGKDSYNSPHNGVFKGLGDTDAKFYGIDAAYALSDKVSMTAYWNYGEQSQKVNHSLYVATLENKNSTLGLGVTGKQFGRFDWGANLSYTDDKNRYLQGLETLSNTAATIATNTAFLAAQGGLPDTIYRVTTLSMFGKYSLDKKSAVRLDLVHQRAKWDDWAWGYAGVPFFISDNTTVSHQVNQNVTFIGVSYLYKFQ